MMGKGDIMTHENKGIDKKAKIRKKVKKLLAEIARVNDDKIKEDAKIRDDLGVDSVSSMEILAAIETRLGIVIDEARAFNGIKGDGSILLTESNSSDKISFKIRQF